MTTNAVQNALNALHQEWLQYAEEMPILEADMEQYLADEKTLARAEAGTEHCAQDASGAAAYTTHNPVEIANDKAVVNSEGEAIMTIENGIAAQCGGVLLFSTLNSAIGLTGTKGDILAQNPTHETTYLTTLFAALAYNIQGCLAEQNTKNLTAANNPASLNAMVQQMIYDDGQEQTDLGQLMSVLLNDYVSYNQKYDNAKVEHASYNPLLNSLRLYTPEEDKEDEIMENARAMKKEISSIIEELAPSIAQVSSSEFIQVQFLFHHVMHELSDVLGKAHVSQEEVGKILGLVMFVLGLFQVIEQAQENTKTEYEKLIAQANMDATKMNMANQQASQQIAQETYTNEQTMQTFQIVTTLVAGLASALTGGAATAALMIALTMLSLPICSGNTSVLGNLTKKIAKAIGNDLHNQDTGKILADIIVTVCEVVLTGGAVGVEGFAARAAVKTIVQESVDSAMQASQETIENAVAQATKDMTNPNQIAAARQVVEKAFREAAEKAARGTAQHLSRQSMGAIGLKAGRSILRKIGMNVKGTLGAEIKKTTEEAATLAGKTAVKSTRIVKLATQMADVAGTTTSTLIESLAAKTITKEAATAADNAIAETLNIDVSSTTNGILKRIARTLGINTTKEPTDISATKNLLIRAGKAAVLGGTFGIGNNNLLMDIATAVSDKHNKTLDTAQLIAAELTQAILQMVAMFFALSSGIPLTQAPVALMRFAMISQGCAQAVGSAASFQMANMLEVQADTETGLQMANAIAELLHTTLQEMEERLKSSQEAYVEKEKTESRLMNQLAIHLYDGTSAGNKAFLEIAG